MHTAREVTLRIEEDDKAKTAAWLWRSYQLFLGAFSCCPLLLLGPSCLTACGVSAAIMGTAATKQDEASPFPQEINRNSLATPKRGFSPTIQSFEKKHPVLAKAVSR